MLAETSLTVVEVGLEIGVARERRIRRSGAEEMVARTSLVSREVEEDFGLRLGLFREIHG